MNCNFLWFHDFISRRPFYISCPEGNNNIDEEEKVDHIVNDLDEDSIGGFRVECDLEGDPDTVPSGQSHDEKIPIHS